MSYFYNPVIPDVKLKHANVNDGQVWTQRKSFLLPPVTLRQLTRLANSQKTTESQILISLLNLAAQVNKPAKH